MPLIGATHADAAVPLQLLFVDTIGSETTGWELAATPQRVPVTAIRLGFSLPPDPVLGDFRVFAAGADQRFDTSPCAAGPAQDDVVVAIAAIVAAPLRNEVTLRLGTPRGLPTGRYQVHLCDSLHSASGTQFDGDGDALPGGHALRTFAIGETPLLDNPNFNTGIAGWTFASVGTSPFQAGFSPLDLDGALDSGALRIAGEGPAAVLISSATCVSMSTLQRHRLRFTERVLQGTVRVATTVRFGFAGDVGEPDCVGPATGSQSVAQVAEASGQVRVVDSGRRVTSPGPNAHVTLLVTSDDGPFQVLLDDIGFLLDSDGIFESPFD